MRTVIPILALLFTTTAVAEERGTISGTLGPTAPKQAAVWLEGVPAGSWSLPKEIPKVSQRGARFSPDFLVIAVGQTVDMPNDDRITHNVFSVSTPKRFDLGHYPQGQSRTVKFDKPGVIDLFCNIHENMHATLVVAPSTFFTTTTDGRFTIGKVPPGTYKLVALAPGLGTTSTTITVAAGATATATLTLEGK